MKLYPTYKHYIEERVIHIWIGKKWFGMAEGYSGSLKLVKKKFKRPDSFKRIKYEIDTVKSTTIKPRS